MDTKGKPTLIDLFAGCGGLSLGLENAGFQSIYVNELNNDALDTYLINREDNPLLRSKFSSNDIKDVIKNDPEGRNIKPVISVCNPGDERNLSYFEKSGITLTVKKYMEDPNIGVEKVEKILDACHSIKYQVPRTPGIKRRSHSDLKKYYKSLMLKDTHGKWDDFDINKIPLEPDSNLLGFIAEHNRFLEDWERDLIRIVEKESLYFVPQAYTKIMNEGWACMIHEKILEALGIPDSYYFSFIKLHNQVVRPHLGRINPYHLGYKIFKRIEKDHGFEKCLLVRETHNDETFIKSYLDRDLCEELNLFSYSFSRKEGYNKITDVSNENTWRTVRDDLITNIGLNSVPVILVEELKKTELINDLKFYILQVYLFDLQHNLLLLYVLQFLHL